VFYDKVNSCVYKTATNTANVVKWYAHADEVITSYCLRVPKIHTVIGDTIKMEYIPFDNSPSRVDTVFVRDILQKFQDFLPVSSSASSSAYVERCTKRMTDVLDGKSLKTLQNILHYAMGQTPHTFGHGDFSYENVLWSREHSDRVYLIDPIYEDGLFSSYVIDAAKYCLTLDRAGHTEMAEELRLRINLGKTLRAHELGHLCRMYPYSPDKLGILTEIYHLIHVLR